MSDCPKCGSPKTFNGYLNSDDLKIEFEGASYDVQFVPGRLARFKFSVRRGVPVNCSESTCCLECGMVWTALDVELLKKHINEKCNDDVRERLNYILTKKNKA